MSIIIKSNNKESNNTGLCYLLIQPTGEHEQSMLRNELNMIKRGTKARIDFVAFNVDDWNQELSPWEAPPVYGKEAFGSGAEKTLSFVVNDLIPEIKRKIDVDDSLKIILGGYSLAGLFSLWSAYQTDVFDAVVCASPSVWFPGWIDYARAHKPKCGSIYLSLGTKEEKVRNEVLRTVGDKIKETKSLLDNEVSTRTVLEWNQGTHFTEPDQRLARGFCWCMNTIV